MHSKSCIKRPLKKKTKIVFQDRLLLNALLEHSAILLTFIKLPFVIKTFVLSFFERPLESGFYVLFLNPSQNLSSEVRKKPLTNKIMGHHTRFWYSCIYEV